LRYSWRSYKRQLNKAHSINYNNIRTPQMKNFKDIETTEGTQKGLQQTPN
jgi:hypothetical protein